MLDPQPLAFIAPAPARAGAAARHPDRPAHADRLRRGPVALLLALVLGGLAALGFAPVGLFAATLFALAALYLLAEAAPARAFALGFAWALGHFAVSLRWIAEAFTYQDKMPPELGWVAVVGLAALLALIPAAGLWAAHRTTRRAGRAARLWALPAAWIAAEWVRGHLLTGFPWNPLAAATLGVPWLAQPAAVLGAFGLSGLIALAAAALALRRWRGPLGVAALVAAAAALEAGLNPVRPAPPATLLIVQPNIGQQEKWQPGAGGRALDTLVALSRRPAPSATPRLILWPEVALPENLIEREPGTRALLATLLRPGDLLLTGGLSVDFGPDGEPTRAANSVFALDSRGRILARYDKAHLTPGANMCRCALAEPLGLTRLAPGGTDFTPGPGPRTLTLPGVPAVGIQICYEMIFPGAAVDAHHRPAWLFNPSNDAWFADSGPAQHLALARLRAIEEGLPVVRATPTGISAIIDTHGGLAATLPQHQPGVIEAALPGARAPTPFARLGNAAPLGLALLFAGLAALARDRTRI